MGVWENCGLIARFDPERGNELVVTRDGGIDPSDISRVQTGMLEHHRLERTVPVRVDIVDGRASIRYGIAGLRKLTAAVRSGSVRAEHWKRLLAGISLAIREGAQYCIWDTEYVLDPDWVWVKGEARDIVLMSVPLTGFGSSERAWEQWQALFETMAEHGLPERLKKRLQPGNWERSTFSHRLWIEALEDMSADEEPAAQEAPGFEDEDDTGKFPALAFTGGIRAGREKAAVMEEDGDTFHFPKRLGALRGLAQRFISPGKKASSIVKAKDSDSANGKKEDFIRSLSSLEAGNGEPLDLRTVLLSDANPEATVKLSSIFGVRVCPKLEITHEEQESVEIVEFSGQRLRLGRGPDGVDVMVRHCAASRAHLEFGREGEAVFARDLGSTNGTYYLDQPMRPNERYELHDGDLLRLPGAVVKVHLSSASSS